MSVTESFFLLGLYTVVNEGDVLKLQGDETADEESIFFYFGLDMNGCFDGGDETLGRRRCN